MFIDHLPAGTTRLLASNDPGSGPVFARIRDAVPGQLAFEQTDEAALAVLVSPARVSRMTCGTVPPCLPCQLGDGEVMVVDLRCPPPVRFGDSVDLVRADIPRSVLQAFARKHGWGEVAAFSPTKCGDRDATLSALLGSLGPYFDEPREGGALVVAQIALAVMAQLLSAYSNGGVDSRSSQGRLASWQEKRVKELIDENLTREISVSWLAGEIGLSESYFARAFRESVGMPPYQWLIERRVSRAKALMKDKGRSLTEIALSAGFADQSHFSRAFSRVTGMPPGVWRRTAAM